VEHTNTKFRTHAPNL